MKDLLAVIDLYDDDDTRVEFNKGGDAERKRKLQIAYDKYGKDNLDKGAKVLGFKNFETMRGEKNANFRKKIFKELEEFGEVMTEEGSRQRSRQTRIPREQGIQIKLLNELNNKKFFDPKKFAKKNDISLKTLKAEAVKLRNNIYDKRMLVSGKQMRSTLEWIPDDLQAADTALNKMWKSKLIVNDRGKIENLFYDAFGNPNSPTFNPKKHLAIRNKLTEYYKLRDAITAKYPNIKFELDHPLSKSSLNKIFNATADQLTFVNPLTKDLNNGFKDSLSLQYEKAVEGKNLNKKKAVEKIAKDLKLNIGKISNDATNFKYGVKEFQKLDIKEELLKAVRTQSDLSSSFKTYVKNNPELFKTAGVSTQQTFTRITPSQIKGVENLLLKLSAQVDKDCAQAVADGGRIGLQSIGSKSVCITKAKNYMTEQLDKGIGTQQNAKTSLIKRIISGTGQFIKQGLSPKELLKLENLVGKPALYATAVIETGFLADDVLRKKEPINVAAAENFLFGSLLNLNADAERAKNLLESGVKLSPAAQTYAQGIIDQDNFRRLSQTYSTNLVKNPLFIPSGAKAKADTVLENLKNKIANTSETGALDYQSALDELEGTFKAKPKFLDAPDAPDVTPLINKLAQPSGKRVGPMTAKKDMQIDLSLPTYDRSLTASDDLLNQYFKSIGQEPLAPGEGTLFRMREPNQKGLFGTQEKFAGGGIAKLAGIDEGPQIASMNPNSQGLRSLKNRAKKV